MDLTITTLAERPHLAEPMWAMDDSWAEFVGHDLVARSHMSRIPDEFPEYVLLATDGQERVVARAFSVPFALRSKERGGDRGELPDGGWDQVLVWAFADRRYGDETDTVSAIEVAVDPARQGLGLSGRMLAAMRENARAHGFTEVVAPVRPNAKHREPATSMAEYARRTRDDGLPYDPWLRVHVRVGGVVAKVAPVSMTVSGSLAQWREWTGLPFDRSGGERLVEVPGALVPVRCTPERDCAVYVEPNVWVRHAL
ncbi:N-acetyltransferase [Streptomyces sp. NPDC053474]|uniref:N-acetyltransferase n=1 Tax=Streptomyces sp. NPDC053474 TaxID=3365704 RepID=UPI0037D35602